MKMQFFLPVVLALGVSACVSDASMTPLQQQDWIKANCNVEGAYNTGLNQGMTQDTYIQNNFAALCPVGNQAKINNAYKQGFLEGLKHRPAEVNKNVTTRNCTSDWWC